MFEAHGPRGSVSCMVYAELTRDVSFTEYNNMQSRSPIGVCEMLNIPPL